MTSPRDDLLRDLACGDRSLHEPEVQALLAANPDWRAELQQMQALGDRLSQLEQPSRSLTAEAEGLQQPGDATRVRHALRAPRRRLRLALAALFLLPLLPLALMLPTSRDAASHRTQDGRLGIAADLRLDDQQTPWQLQLGHLPAPGCNHRLVMLAPDGRMLEAAPEVFPWQLPAEWQQLAAAAGAVQFELSSCEPGGVPELRKLDWSRR